MKLSLITKAVLTTAVLFVATTGLASAKHMSYKGENLKGEACPPPPALMGGFYVGGQVGYDNYRVRQRFYDIDGDYVSNPLNANGWVGGLFLGYGQYFTNFYLGGEAFGNYSGADGTITVADATLGTTKFKSQARGSWGLALLPGVKLSDTLLLYARGGYTWANLKGSVSVNSVNVGSKSNNRGGWAYGLGMESLIWDAWSLRGEFTHTDFGNHSKSNNGATVKFSSYDNQFMLGAVYHFA